MVNRKRLGEAPEKATERRLRRVESAAPIGYSSVTRGGLRIASAQGLTAQSVPGGAPAIDVTGRQRVSGLLDGDGTFDWDGPAFFRDTLDVSAETTLRSLVTLMADLVLSTGGKITSGNVVIDPSDSGGVIKVGNLKIVVTGTGVNLSAHGHQIVFNTSGISIVTAGGKSIIMQNSPGAFQFGGLPTIPRANANNATVGTVYSDGSGNLSRVVL
ncbi:hypothetical protein [Microbacterium sp. ZW T5_56]|uniref:hypothetical protein n=1 Tax=Microbacterium sp. ZW T5_56 TaxID=3378081 RepID=UPI003854AE44